MPTINNKAVVEWHQLSHHLSRSDYTTDGVHPMANDHATYWRPDFGLIKYMSSRQQALPKIENICLHLPQFYCNLLAEGFSQLKFLQLFFTDAGATRSNL